jgi:thiol-disulfide isomerase/thioredoxin
MKKIVYSLALLAISSAAFAQAPVKKVILEDFTGTWCGWCPEGTVVLEQLQAANPTNFIPVASHNGDGLEVPDGAAIDNGLNVTAYPNGAVDRFQFSGEAKIPVGRGKWSGFTNNRLATTAIVSVSFVNPKYDGTNYTATVNVKFTQAPVAGVPLKMNVYLLEDSIPATGALAQSNYSNAVQGGADPLTNWFHNATLRKALGGAWGFSTTIPGAPVVGTVYSENISFTIPATWVKKNVNVVAFVAYDGTAAANRKEILNAEQYPLKWWFPTSIENVASNKMNIASYPNPATSSSVVKTSFYLSQDANVSLEVLNSVGQVVSAPYTSFEIEGAHTIQWSPRQFGNLGSGMYFVRISTDKGEQAVSRLLID